MPLSNSDKARLRALGIDPETGRKIRSDAGHSHNVSDSGRQDMSEAAKRGRETRAQSSNKQTKRRKDIGAHHEAPKATKLAIYARVKGRLLKNNICDDSDQSDYFVRTDENGIFVPMKKDPRAVHEFRAVTIHTESGSYKSQRYVQYRNGYVIDLEHYRWDALYELVENNVLDEPINSVFKREAEVLCVDNHLDLALKLYHLSEKQYTSMTYKEWRELYDSEYELATLEGRPIRDILSNGGDE